MAAGTAAFAASASAFVTVAAAPPPPFLPHAAITTSNTIVLFMISSLSFTSMNAEGTQLLVQVRSLDAERLRRSRDVPVELREPDAYELALDLLAELAQRFSRVAPEVDRRDRPGVAGLQRAGGPRPAEVRRQRHNTGHLEATAHRPLAHNAKHAHV